MKGVRTLLVQKKRMIKGLIIPQEDHHQQQLPVVLMEENMSNLTSASGDQTSVSSGANINRAEIDGGGCGIYHPHHYFPPHQTDQPPPKKKRNLPGNPDPDAEVIALSPKTLMATNRFVCEICNKGFQRDQNLQLHRRGHNLPWKLNQRISKEVVRRKVYVCPEESCAHHEASRALGDLTGIKKHFCRKHGEKKWKCDKCTKRYAVQSDWKAHSKTCGTREYRCDCGTLFSRRDSFITHRAFCDALAEESARISLATTGNGSCTPTIICPQLPFVQPQLFNNMMTHDFHAFPMRKEQQNYTTSRQTPPWLAAGGQDGPQPQTILLNMDHHHDLTSSYHDQEFTIQHTQDNNNNNNNNCNSNPNPNPNPSSSTSVGPNNQLLPAYVSKGGSSSSSSPHMSATALLQKAAQMGSTLSTSKTSTTTASSSLLVLPPMTMTMTMTRPHQSDHVPSNTAGFGLNLSSREQELATGFLASFGNKAAALSGSVSPAGAGVPPPKSCFIDQDVMMMMMSSSRNSTRLSSSATRASGFDHQRQAMATSTFEDYGFTTTGLLMDSKKHDDHHHKAYIGEAAQDDGMTTRDFLGLRPQVSHTHHILSIPALQPNCINTSTSDE